MKIQTQYSITFILLLAGLQTVFAQKKDENIGTEVVNVVKPYTPSVSDAFKVKEVPSLDDEDNSKKQIINYSFFSFPVASTFTPSKGKAAGVDKPKQETLYKNYIIGGIGNYFTPLAELYVTQDVGNNDYVAGMFSYLSSSGDIKDIPVNNGYLNSAIDLTYGSKQNGFSWNADLGYQIQKYHWYGLPTDFASLYTPDELDAIYDDIDEPQTYNNLYVGGKLKFNEGIFKEVNLKYGRFWDAFDSAENRFIATPSMEIDINHETIKTNFLVDYVGGSFDNGLNAINYGFTNFGINPNFAMQQDDWAFNIGLSLVYSLDAEHSENKFYVYPKIDASLHLVGDLMIFYAGADGDLQQNSYRDFTNVNSFLSPNLMINPTSKQYEIFAGLKGKLSNALSYNLKGSYANERNKSLFLSNVFNETIVLQEEYQYGNSFGVVYDDVNTVRFFGELKGDFSDTVSFGINGTFSSYATGDQLEAWNLPAIKMEGNLNVKITSQWFAGASLFFVGERKDMIQTIDVATTLPVSTVQTLDSYFDINLNVGYRYNDRITGFLRLNNVANQAYQKWMNYPVQSFQIMLGASYKFDF